MTEAHPPVVRLPTLTVVAFGLFLAIPTPHGARAQAADHLPFAPGERLTFHRHVLDYFWTCVSGGDALSRDGDGNIRARRYEVAETPGSATGEYLRRVLPVYAAERALA